MYYLRQLPDINNYYNAFFYNEQNNKSTEFLRKPEISKASLSKSINKTKRSFQVEYSNALAGQHPHF